mmetsp:Transcript_37883/g.74005  ORF Transcript_37883/g.74005 Transcript_37883/m.74005 type:complete len:494 (+) Transcript_37883:76-1557(+)
MSEVEQAAATRRKASTYSEVFARMHFDQPMKSTRPTTVVGFLAFEHPVDSEHIEGVVAKLLRQFPRFRSRLVRTGNAVYFEEIELDQIDMSYHIQVHTDCANWGQEQIDCFLSGLYNESKDVHRPMWRFHILNHVKSNKHFLVPDIDHSVGDGTSLVSVLNAILDTPFGTHAEGTKLQKTWTPTEPSYAAAGPCCVTVCSVIEGLILAVLNPHLPQDPVHTLKRSGKTLSVVKRSAVTEGADLAMVRNIKSKFPGCTINDVLTAVMGICLRRVYEEANDDKALTWRGVTAALPVNCRPPGNHCLEMGNKIGSRVVRLGMQHATRVDAVWRVMRQTTYFRLSPLCRIEQVLSAVAVKLLPSFLLIALIREMNFKATLVMSNVAGPPTKVHVGGREVKNMMFYGCGPVPLYVGFFTYDGQVTCGIVADGELPHPSRIARHWKKEIEGLWAELETMPPQLPPPSATIADWAYCLALLSCPAVLVMLLSAGLALMWR